MKIVHLCLASFYIDNYSYQENLLPKYHKKMGYDVEIIASLQSFDDKGKVCYLEKASSYINENEIPVTRLAYRRPVKMNHKSRKYIGLRAELDAKKPDILFIHGCQFLDIKKVISYAKQHKNIKIFIDNHADYANSATNWLSKNVLHKFIWRHMAHEIEQYTTKFYGVLPVRVDFLVDIYNLPKAKCELLVMGADDEMVESAREPHVRPIIRKQYGIREDDFLIITGGKIDMRKQQTLLLMDAVNSIKDSHVKLIVFGSIIPELKEEILKRCSDFVKYIGWLKKEKTYELFASSDLAAFPSGHSVLWEQAAGQGVPLLVKDWPGTHHVDVGNNVLFIKFDTVEEIKRLIDSIVNNNDLYLKMKRIAEEKGMPYFSYADIARKSISS